MLEYCVTKYDPIFRDSKGVYSREEWTSATDIGRSFGGSVLTREQYQRVEDAYVAVAMSFLCESGLSSLVVEGLENSSAHRLPFGEGSALALEQLAEVIRRMLREEFWCRLEGTAGFVHIGWNYYMYVGVPSLCPKSQELARRYGLFVERVCSPYTHERSGKLT